MSNINNLIIKPAYRGSGLKSLWGGDLNKQQTEDLIAHIKDRPLQYVAQERIQKAHIPTYVSGQLEPRPSILRSFAVASDSSYTVMPGGLTRIGLEPGSQIISMQSGCPSKDTWITATEPERVLELNCSG